MPAARAAGNTPNFLPGMGVIILETQQALDRFLATIEGRALRMAEFATGNRDDALEIVQDAMMKLAQRYAGKPEQDWPPLFYRILQSHIRDWYRRSKVRNRFRVWFGDGDEHQHVLQEQAGHTGLEPEQQISSQQAMGAVEQAIQQLPLRQQQALLLRMWEGLDVQQTASAMNCSTGSVKTHYSRAINQLRQQLGDHWP